MSSVIEDMETMLGDRLLSHSLDTCLRWSQKMRVMGGSFPGSYQTTWHPWCATPIDATSDFLWFQKAAQLGISEIAINRALYVIDRLKQDVLYVLPTGKIASDFSKSRFNPALQLSPKLNALFTDTNSVGLKIAGSVNLYIRGSRGESNLDSVSVATMILDEVDRMDASQILIALERLSGQLQKSVWGISTPSIPGKGINALYVTGSQEHFFFKCPGCSRRTEMIWPDSIEICGDSITDPDIERSYLKCKECGRKIVNEEKPQIFSTAVWEPTVTDYDASTRSFYINQLYSFTVSAKELAVAHFRSLGNDGAAEQLWNRKIGLPYIVKGAQLTEAQVQKAVQRGMASFPESRGYRRGDLEPESAGRLITLGVDQGKTNYFWVDEWFVEQYGLNINMASRRRCLDFGTFLEEDWDELQNLMCQWQVQHCVIDADPNINEARRFARYNKGYVTLCRYREGKVGKEMSISEAEGGAPIATVDRTNWLAAGLGRFKQGTIELPTDIDTQLINHICNPIRRHREDSMGGFVAYYATDDGQDHYAHAYTYGEIALPLAAARRTGKNLETFL